MIPTNLVSPLVGELGLGGVGGFCVGYSMKKIAKIVTAIFAIGFLGLQYLATLGIISINYLALEEWAISMFGETSTLQGFLIILLAQMPFGVGFTGGLVLGLKKG
ncbi:hypothetical protein MCGE09_00470 [Thaumarchaeota archaeon SCGC AB-539-E09]|nr:hypothetical protein MCGE09_00470 [Thaumarchaeota archaeon SCGC AB-539-E09]